MHPKKQSSAFFIVALFLLCFICGPVCAQKIEFAKKEDTIYVERGKSKVYTAQINCVGCIDEQKFRIQKLKGNLPDSSFTVQVLPDTFRSKSSTLVYINVIANNAKNYGKVTGLEIENVTNASEKASPFFLHIMEPPVEVDSTRYRLMIGTNFDFIDGIKPQSVYYNLQFFTPSAFSKRFGFVGGIQQNRQVSQIDTIFNQIGSPGTRAFRDSARLAAYTQVGVDEFRIIRLDSVKYHQVNTTSVFQIYFEPTFKIYKNSSPKAQTDIYFLIHTDLNFRRTKYEESYNYKVRDTVIVDRRSMARHAAINATKQTITINTYHYYYGAGAMIHHENKYVDLYAKFMFGGANIEKGQWKGFYGSELGVRIPSINVMFGSEYRGFYNEHNPSYLNVYLSKVVSLNKLFDFILK